MTMLAANLAPAQTMTALEAEKITTRIDLRLTTAAENFTAARELIREAIEKQAHVALGFASPGAYLAAKFGGSLQALGFEQRREVVQELSDAGLSTRAIAPVVGVSQKTVNRDAQAPRESGDSRPTPVTTGLDGKSYPALKPRRRPALTDQFQNIVNELDKWSRRLESVMADDRVPKHLNELASQSKLLNEIDGRVLDAIEMLDQAASR